MCRLLLLHHPEGVDPAWHLEQFRALSRESREYQGHGWGCAWLDADREWRLYHDIRPVWADPGPQLPRTPLFIAHARSAFRDEGITVENNMPFRDGQCVFAFNGELRGVRIRAPGRIGAEKVFKYIKRFDRGNMAAAATRGVEIIERRTRYVRAMNFFLAERDRVHICSHFSEDPDYFALRETEIDEVNIVCSAPYPDARATWRELPNHSLRTVCLADVS